MRAWYCSPATWTARPPEELVTLARLVRVPGMSVVRGPAFGALASGTAILVAPVVLAALGAALDLRAAYVLAVLPLAAALATAARRESSCP